MVSGRRFGLLSIALPNHAIDLGVQPGTPLAGRNDGALRDLLEHGRGRRPDDRRLAGQQNRSGCAPRL